jgi:hypothetical protein
VRASLYEKIFFTVIFVAFGLPAGLFAIHVTPDFIELAHYQGGVATTFLLLFGIPYLIAIAIFAVLLWWLIRAWRRGP